MLFNLILRVRLSEEGSEVSVFLLGNGLKKV